MPHANEIVSASHRRVPIWLAMLALFLMAFGLRCVGIRWGLPNSQHFYSYHPDEWLVLLASYFTMNPYAGDWLPGFYNYGTLPLTLWSGWLHWLSAVGVIPSLPENPTAVQVAYLRAELHFWARLLNALLGAGTAVIVARTLAQVAGERAGTVAGLAMALAPAFVVHSRFQTVDVPTTFFVALALHQSTALWQATSPWRTLLWGAVWAGCAAGSKYNAGLVLLAIWMSGWLHFGGNPRRLIHSGTVILASTAVAGLTFLLVCPGSWADREQFWRNFLYELRHVQQGHGEIFTNTGLGWLYHLYPNISVGFTLAGLVLGVMGWLWMGRRYRALWGVALASLAYYGLIGSAEVRFLRYTFPVFPFLAMGQGLWLAQGGQFTMGAGRWLVPLVLALQALYALDYTGCMVRPDSRDQAVAWIRQRVPSHASIGFATVPWFYTPPLFPETGELFWRKRLEAMRSADSTYRLISLAPPEWSAENLRLQRPDYLIISEFEARDVARIARADYIEFMRALQEEYVLVETFSNGPLLLGYRHSFPHDMLYICPETTLWGRKAVLQSQFSHGGAP